MKRDVCEDCRAFEAERGECRIRAPVLIVRDGTAAWPPVRKDDWCLEFEAAAGGLSSSRGDRAVEETLARRRVGG